MAMVLAFARLTLGRAQRIGGIAAKKEKSLP